MQRSHPDGITRYLNQLSNWPGRHFYPLLLLPPAHPALSNTPDPNQNILSASVGEQTMGSPRRLSEVLSTTPLPVIFSISVIARNSAGCVLFDNLSTGGTILMDDLRHPLFQDSATLKVKVIKGEGWSVCNISTATESKILGQKGRQRSRNLICSFIRSATLHTGAT